jgi:transposase
MTPALVCEIVTLFHGGESQRRIAQTLRIGRKAVRRVLELVEHACIDSAEQRPAQPEKRRPSLLDAFETTIADLLARYPNITIQRLREELRRSGYAGGHTILSERVRALRPRQEEESRQWMLRVLQCKERSDKLRPLVNSDEDLRIFVNTLRNGKLRDRNRVMAVLADRRGISRRSISRFLHLRWRSIESYCSMYRIYGCARLFKGFRDRLSKSDDELLQNTLFSVLHTPPSAYGINRTTWRMADLRRVLAEKGQKACPEVIREIIKAAGYSWKKAREVLTSTDPRYQEKLAKIQSILSTLGPNERFFSIDEYGPFSVKMQGGSSLTPPGTVRVIPQRQKSKGSLIITAALELSTNQVTHFYSDKKNTAEMIKLLEILVKQYAETDKIYLSWDAASWHASKLFYKRVDLINSPEYRAEHKTPHVELAPLPSCAQFLNVIESVFSGMARAIIHNSDYDSLAACKAAIDRHFAERNAFFQANPKKAGRIIWGKEITPSTFSPANNCKNRHHFFFGL